MIITPEIKAFCADRAPKVAPSALIEDIKFEEATLLNVFTDAESYCSECFATKADGIEHHYLGCSWWDFNFMGTAPVNRPTQIKD